MMVYTAASVRDVSVDADALGGLTWLGQELWYADPVRGRAVPIDPVTGAAGRPVDCPRLSAGLTSLHGHLVYAADDGARMRVVDPETGRRVAELFSPRDDAAVTAMEIGRDGMWLGFRDSLELRSAPEFALISRLPAPLGTTGITVTDRYLLFSDQLGECITVVDLSNGNRILRIHVDGRTAGLAWDGRRLWYGDATNLRLRAVEIPGLGGF